MAKALGGSSLAVDKRLTPPPHYLYYLIIGTDIQMWLLYIVTYYGCNYQLNMIQLKIPYSYVNKIHLPQKVFLYMN